jgi:hypothetical protein
MKLAPYLVAAFCLVALQAHAEDNQPKFTLNADEAPDSKPWSEPATLSYTKDAGEKAAFVLDAAARWDWRVGNPKTSTNTGFGRLVAHRNTTTGEQVESYSAEVGLHIEPKTKATTSNHPSEGFSTYHDLSLGYVYTTNFDDEADGCDETPKPATCVRSHGESIRLKWTLQPYHPSWDSRVSYVGDKPSSDSPNLAHSFGFLLTPFADAVVDAKAVDGVKPDGTVAGVAAHASLALSPKFRDYRLVFSASVQQTEAFIRSNSREQAFPSDSTLLKLSLDYDLGPRAFLKEKGWAPSIGVAYVKGDNPLAGKLDQEQTVFGVRLTYTP